MGVDGEVPDETFRRVMGRFATGVTVVTTLDGDRPLGITVNALTSVSLDPPLVVVALDTRRRIIPALRAAGRFGVNILAEDQEALSDCFAGAPVVPDRDAFCGATWRAGSTGVPLIAGCLGTLECEIDAVTRLGDHELVVGRVVATRLGDGEPHPLLYYRRRYLRIERATTATPGRPEES